MFQVVSQKISSLIHIHTEALEEMLFHYFYQTVCKDIRKYSTSGGYCASPDSFSSCLHHLQSMFSVLFTKSVIPKYSELVDVIVATFCKINDLRV